MKTRMMPIGLKITLEKAQRDPVAAYNAASILEAGHWGQSATQHFFLRAALGGYAPAMIRIAGFYMTGQFLIEDENGEQQFETNVDEGVNWIKQAANTGDATANYLLARCYADGIGMKQNLIKAVYFLGFVPFSGQINPYEPSEALVFGCVSKNLRDCIRRKMKSISLKPAG